MRTKQEILEKICRMKEEASSDLGLFGQLEKAVKTYFDPTDLQEAVAGCVYQMAFNYEYRNTVYQNMESLPAFRTDNFPTGFRDVGELLHPDVWEEIMDAKPDFPLPSLGEWAARIGEARESLLQGLEAIDCYCEQDAVNYGLAVKFAEPGQMISGTSKKETAEYVYLKCGYLKLIRGFDLDVHVPDFLPD